MIWESKYRKDDLLKQSKNPNEAHFVWDREKQDYRVTNN
jgi:hypothetical protein